MSYLRFLLTGLAEALAEHVGADGDLVGDADLPLARGGRGGRLLHPGRPHRLGGGRQAVRGEQLLDVHPGGGGGDHHGEHDSIGYLEDAALL